MSEAVSMAGGVGAGSTDSDDEFENDNVDDVGLNRIDVCKPTSPSTFVPSALIVSASCASGS